MSYGTCEIVEFFCVKVGGEGPAHPLDTQRGVEQLQQLIAPQQLKHFHSSKIISSALLF